MNGRHMRRNDRIFRDPRSQVPLDEAEEVPGFAFCQPRRMRGFERPRRKRRNKPLPFENLPVFGNVTRASGDAREPPSVRKHGDTGERPGRTLLKNGLGTRRLGRKRFRFLSEDEFLRFSRTRTLYRPENDVLRDFIMRYLFPAKRYQFVFRNRMPVLKGNEGARNFSPFLVSLCHDRGFLDRRMEAERVFHFDGRDVFPSGYDDVLQPVGNLQVSVGMYLSYVSRMKPSVFERFGGRGFVLEIFLHDDVSSKNDFAFAFPVVRQYFARRDVHDFQSVQNLIGDSGVRGMPSAFLFR